MHVKIHILNPHRRLCRFAGESTGLKFILSESDLFRVIPESVSELFRVIPNQSEKRFPVWWKMIKNHSYSILLINPNSSEPIWINPSSDWSISNFKSEFIRMNPSSEWFGLIVVENPVRIYSDWCTELNRIDFYPFFIKQDTKRSSDWFGMTRNSFDSLEMNFSLIFLPGFLYRLQYTFL